MVTQTKGKIVEQLEKELLKIRVVKKVEVQVQTNNGATLRELNEWQDEFEQVILVINHKANEIEDSKKYFAAKQTIKSTALKFFKDAGIKLGDPIEDNGTYYYFVFYNTLKTA
jgi:SET domain-containing protein